MTKVRSPFIPISCMLVIPLVHTIYIWLNQHHQRAEILITGLDKAIPFMKVFILPYISWYPFMFVTLCYLCLKDRNSYYKTLISITIGLLTCYTIYYFFQTTVPRPDLQGGDLLVTMVNMVYAHDQPYNCFPSIHCLTSYLIIKGMFKSKVKNKTNFPFVATSGMLIIISTLFVKQHVVLDVFAAIMLGELLFRIVAKFDTDSQLYTAGFKRPRILINIKKKLWT